MALFRLNRVSLAFGDLPIFTEVDFAIEPGERVCLIGRNGAGKTTLLRILASLARPTAGEVRIAGLRLPEQAAEVRRLLGVVSHLPLLYGDLTAEENLLFYSRLYALPQAARRAGEVLDLVGLSARRRDLVRQFSRGMQQRLAIARALLHDPQVMLFDEPHTGLDPEAAAMLDGVLTGVAARGRTVVMTTHDLERAAALAARLDILARGVIVRSLPRGEVPPAAVAELYRAVTHA